MISVKGNFGIYKLRIHTRSAVNYQQNTVIL